MRKFNAAIILIAAFSACFSLSGCYNEAKDFQRLVQSPASVDGTVVYTECNQHGGFVYSFVVADHEYRTRTSSPNCSAMKVGDKVPVFYDPAHPATNTLLPPERAYQQAKGWYIPEWTMPLIFVPLMVVAGIFHSARRSRASRRDAGPGAR